MNTRKIPALTAVVLLTAGCSHAPVEQAASSNEAPDSAAHRLARSSIIVDTHIDVPYRVSQSPADISIATEDGDFDYPRGVAGGLNVAFMSIYTAAELEAEGKSMAAAESLIDMVETFVAAAPEKFAIARSVGDVRRHFEAGLMSLPMGMENGSPIAGDLDNLRHFYDRGIRYVTPAHSLSNHISDSSYDDHRQWHGLSDFGVEVIREMNRLGIMVDVSHVSDDAFWQIMDISAVPAIASHSSARHFTPGFERNMSDDMIRTLAAKGGVVQINFGSGFIAERTQKYYEQRSEDREKFALEHPELSETEIYEQHSAQYAIDNGPMPLASLSDVLDHFDHVVKLAGVDHVGIGSDYDGVGDSLPEGLKDVSSYPNLVQGLLQRGYSEPDIKKILGENLLRVWQQVEDFAAAAQASAAL
ncbi:MAG: dipeptidase [Gammaproteobacteria bacterium]|nr:dipeptidase [Gammaproteobacteria bacterium]